MKELGTRPRVFYLPAKDQVASPNEGDHI